MRIEDLVRSFDYAATPQTILRGTGAFENGSGLTNLVTLTYGPSIAVPLTGGLLMTVTVTDNVAFAFANPTAATLPLGGLITVLIRNTSGGAHGAGTFGTNYRVAGNVPAIATANSRAIVFVWNGTLMIELVRGATDVPV